MSRLIGFLLIAFIATGCATKLERARTDLQGSWRIDRVLRDGQDITASELSSRVDYRIVFTGDNEYQETYLVSVGGDQVNNSGTWDFNNNAEQLTLSGTSQTLIYQVDRIEDGVLDVTDRTTSDVRQIEFRPS